MPGSFTVFADTRIGSIPGTLWLGTYPTAEDAAGYLHRTQAHLGDRQADVRCFLAADDRRPQALRCLPQTGGCGGDVVLFDGWMLDCQDCGHLASPLCVLIDAGTGKALTASPA